MTTTPTRHAASALHTFSRDLLVAAGMPGDKAEAVAGILVEGDLLGHTTHGLQLLPAYLDEIVGGGMACTGEPVVLSGPLTDTTAELTGKCTEGVMDITWKKVDGGFDFAAKINGKPRMTDTYRKGTN